MINENEIDKAYLIEHIDPKDRLTYQLFLSDEEIDEWLAIIGMPVNFKEWTKEEEVEFRLKYL